MFYLLSYDMLGSLEGHKRGQATLVTTEKCFASGSAKACSQTIWSNSVCISNVKVILSFEITQNIEKLPLISPHGTLLVSVNTTVGSRYSILQ